MAQQAASHYDVQKKRRGDIVEEWNRIRKVLGKGARLTLQPSPVRGVRQGMLIGTDGGVPTRSIDCRIVEIPAGGRTSTHRHTYDAIMFVLSGRGYTLIGGERYDWEPWDALHLPAWSWHQHGNRDARDPARYLAFTTAPLMELFNLLAVEELGDSPPPPSARPARPLAEVVAAAKQSGARSSYEAELERALAQEEARRGATRITRWKETHLVLNPKGSKSAFLIDPSLGYRTTGITAVMFQIAPGSWQASHRHGGEAVLYIVEGRGYSLIDGERYDWEAGDGVLVGKWSWHQHFNAAPNRIATVLRMHTEESLGNLMRIVLAPLELFNEPETWDGPDPATLRWPE
jgi:gentisate 1,2-dioxygenase